MTAVRNSMQSEEIKFAILHTMLRPEWPLAHALLRMRVNQLILEDVDCWRPLLNFYTRWLPPPSRQFICF
ncbi:hypothetical protein BIW11_14082, partial [Tropilaelaps mercedesae]